MQQHFLTRAGLAALALLTTMPTWAQIPPDAGQILQQSQPATQTPSAPSVTLDLAGEQLTEPDAGGQQVTLQRIDFRGNTRFDDAQLQAVLGEAANQSQDLASLQGLANTISQFYRDHGYLFARALLPAQTLSDGVLTIEVVEGRYGKVSASSDTPGLAAAAQPWLAPLQSDQVIESASLERQVLLLGDLPGMTVTPVIQPGGAPGQGDLVVYLEPTARVMGLVGTDNHGSRFSGEARGRAGVSANRLLTLGDQLDLTLLYTSEATWLGSLGYSLPLGTSGLRGRLGYAHTDYQLGKGFTGYTGTANVYSADLNYPLIRRQRHNLTLSGGLHYKDLDDNIDGLDVRKTTDSRSLPLGLSFDARDGLGDGGISWGTITLTPGTIDIDQRDGRGRDGSFSKLGIDVSRLQSLGSGFELYGRFNGQWADRADLDGSESLYLGGPNGVRAYPVGEGSDARGWLTQLELRYRAGNGLAPYTFVDVGSTPSGGIDGDARDLAGAGIGLRYQQDGLSLDLASAWQIDGGDAQSDDKQREPRLWGSLSYRF